jgi:hypothetical protein
MKFKKKTKLVGKKREAEEDILSVLERNGEINELGTRESK